MMMASLSRPKRRIAAVGLLVVVILAVASLTVIPLAASIASTREQIDSERAMLGRFTQLADMQDRIGDMQRAGREAGESGAYLKGTSDALRFAGLQSFLAELANANGVRFSSTRALPPRMRDDLRLIGTRVQFNADMEQLREILYTVESSQPFLFVDGVQVRPVSATQRDPELVGLLDVRLDIYGAVPRRKG